MIVPNQSEENNVGYQSADGQTVKIITFPTNETGNIKFGIDAAREVQIHREEIYDTIKQQKQATLQATENISD